LVADTEERAEDFRSLAIRHQEDYEVAGIMLQDVKGRLKRLEELRKGMTRPLDESKRKIMDLFKKPLDRLSEMESIIKRKMLKYCDDVKRMAAEEQRRLEEKAKKEEERKRKQLEARAKKVRESGDDLKADSLQKEAEGVSVPVMRVEEEVPIVDGTYTRKIWKFKIVDQNQIPREYMIPDEALLSSIAKTKKEKAQIPGVEFFFEETIASRGR